MLYHNFLLPLQQNPLYYRMLRIKEILKEKGMTNADLQNELGVSKQYISNIVNGRQSVSMSRLAEIAVALNVPIWQLFASPEEVSSQEFVAFFYHKGKTHTPTTMKEVLDILEVWNESEFKKECHNRDFIDLCDKYQGDKPIRDLIDALCVVLSNKEHPGALYKRKNPENTNNQNKTE